MAKVIIPKKLEEEINKKFGGESVDILELMYSLENNPHKGKELGHVSEIVIKELRYKNFRFYFITDGYKLKIMNEPELTNLLIRFISMSDKKEQQKAIDEIKKILRTLGERGFD